MLRFHPNCPWRDEITRFIPVMLAAFESIKDNSVTAVHRMRLISPSAGLRPNGACSARSVAQPSSSARPRTSILVIGEGVETCLAAEQLGIRPAWALGGVGAIATFPVLPGLETLTILAETGAPSEQAIQTCGWRWHKAGRRVRIVRPDVGSDMNDVLIASAQ